MVLLAKELIQELFAVIHVRCCSPFWIWIRAKAESAGIVRAEIKEVSLIMEQKRLD